MLPALLAAVGFGVSDFFGGLAARRTAALHVVLVTYPLTMVFMGAAAAVAGGVVSPEAVGWGLACGIALGLGGWWFYAALGSGPVAVVSPLSAVMGAAVPVAVGLLSGERPGLIAVGGIVLALVAVALISWQVTDEDATPHRFSASVAAMTIGSGIAFGLVFVLIHRFPGDSGLWPLLFARVSATALILAVAAAGRDVRPASGRALRLALWVVVFDLGANVAALLALRGSELSLTGVLISLFPAVTVILAIVVLRERVHRWQFAGLLLALVAVAMITGV